MNSSQTVSYSAKVELSLHVNGEVLDVSQTGPDSLILREPRQLPATDAQIVIKVDGFSETYPVMLRPMSCPSCEVAYW